MARILHVENEQEWIEIVRRQLADHQVDSADTFEKALILLRDSPAYDLALVDLNLERDNDGLGRELLDLLKIEHPGTRRIVVTARPPSGGVMANIFERYGADEILIKGQLGLPDLRLAVSNSLGKINKVEAAEPPSQELTRGKAALRQRFRDWSEHVERVIHERTTKAAEYLSNAERLHRHAMHRAKVMLDGWHDLQKRFSAECTRLDTLFAKIDTVAQLRSAVEELEHVETRFANEIKIESSGTGG
jgi:CheY-like chemotaxis protein